MEESLQQEIQKILKEFTKNEIFYYYIERIFFMCSEHSNVSQNMEYYKTVAGTKNGFPERVLPHHIEEKISYLFHLKRYYFASQYVRNKNVIDIGCGTGYGSFLLAQYANSVIGIDISKDAIEFAKEYYKKENLKFLQINYEEINKLGKKFDCIIALEFIEHIKEVEKFFDVCKNSLEKNGVLIISTPKKSSPKPINPFHIKEYTPDEFEKILSEKFGNYQIYGEFLRPKTQEDMSIIFREFYFFYVFINFFYKIILPFLPLIYIVRKVFLKKTTKFKNMNFSLHEILFQYFFDIEDILITSSKDDLLKCTQMIAVIFNK